MNEKDISAPSRSAMASQFFNSLHRYKNVLFSKWWILFVCIGLGVGGALSLKWNAPPEFQSSGRMILGAKAPTALGSGGTEEMNNFYGTQIALMQSEVVSNLALLSAQVSNPDLHRCPVTIKVTVSPKTSIFNLRVTGTNGTFTQGFLQAVMDNYILVKKDMRKAIAGSSKDSIQLEVEKVRLQVQASKQAQLDYEASNSVVFLTDQGNQAADYLNRLTHQQAQLKSELQLLKVLSLDENVERQALSLQQATIAASVSTPSATEMKQGGEVGVASDETDTDAKGKSANVAQGLVASQAEYLKTKQQIALLKSQKSELGEFLRPKHPKIVLLDEDIARKEKLLDVYRDQSQDQLKNLQHSLELQIANLAVQIMEWEAKSLEISKKMSEYQTIKQETLRLQAMWDRLSTLVFSIDSDRNTMQENVTILEKASPPVPVSSSLPKLVVLAAGLGFILGLSILVVLDRLDDRPTSFGELKQIIDEEVLGQIPMVRTKDKSSPGIIKEDDDRHAMVEAYRNLRSSIMFLGTPEKHPKTILITSAIPSDGKSMTSANLAITLARSGANVLLVDADLRRGVMHTRFGTRNNPGFSEVLCEQARWQEALIPTAIPNLTLMPRGSTKRHPGELFVVATKDKIFKEIIPQFDYVLFDTAPIMAADDVSNLAPHVDGVIMVIRANYTSGRVARAAMDLLYQRKTNLLGVVFNAVRTHASDYYYYRYKDYYAKSPAK